MIDTLRIVELNIRNIKRVRAVHIAPTGSVVQITGANGQGKTTVLDSIMYALGGERLIPDDVLRRGAESGEVEVDVGEFKVRRTFAEGGKSTLKVTRKDGSPIAGPQTFLAALLGDVAFDPLAFSRMAPKEQAAVLRRVLGLEAAFLAIDQRVSAATEARRSIGAVLRQAEAELAGIPASAKVEPVDMADLVAQAEAAQRTNAENARDRGWLGQAQQAVAGWEKNVADLERRLAEARGKLAEAQAQVAEHRDRIEGLKDVDTAALQQQMRDAQETNRRAEAYRRRSELVQKVAGLKNEYDAKSSDLRAIEDERSGLISKAEIPVPGLAFTSDGVTLNSIQFASCSAAEQLRVSVAVGLAQSPRLRIMLVRDGSLMDSNSMALLAEMAEAHNAQVWVERVDESGDVGVVIEDGAVASD